MYLGLCFWASQAQVPVPALAAAQAQAQAPITSSLLLMVANTGQCMYVEITSNDQYT